MVDDSAHICEAGEGKPICGSYRFEARGFQLCLGVFQIPIRHAGVGVRSFQQLVEVKTVLPSYLLRDGRPRGG
jgi:hypothetical protein